MSGTAAAPSPSWADESLAVVAARRRLAGAVVLVLGVVAIVVTLVAPGVLPPNALVGAAVAVAALLLGVAAVLAVDAADLVVRGVRHVHAAGAQVAATVSPDAEDVHALQAIVGRRARGGRVRVGVVAASRSAGAPGARAAALAETLARTGKRVLLTDLTRGPSGNAGLSDVIAGTHRLRDVVHFDEGIYLGRVAVGTDKQAALAGYDDWVTHLPSDLEVLVTVLPPLADPQVLDATVGMDVVFLQVEIDRTERVDLLASLDALDAVDQSCEIVLVDPTRGSSRAGTTPAVDEPAVEGEASADETSADETSEDDGPTVDDRATEDSTATAEGPESEPDDVEADTSTPAVPGAVGAARAAAAAGTTASPERDRWTSEDAVTSDESVGAATGTDAEPAITSTAPAPRVTDTAAAADPAAEAGSAAATESAAETASEATAPVADDGAAEAASHSDGDDASGEAEERQAFVRPLGATPPPRGNALPEELPPPSPSIDPVVVDVDADADDHDDDPDATRELPRIERPDAVPTAGQDDEPVAAESAPAPPVTSDREQDEEGGDRWLDPRAVWSDLPTRSAASSDAGDEDASADADLVDIGDDVTGEAVRTAAALQALAQQVWSRED